MNKITLPKTISIMIVDDHSLFRRGLIALISEDGSFEVIAQAKDAEEALRHAAKCKPDVILLDHHLPGVKGVDAISSIKEVSPNSQIMILTFSEDDANMVEAFKAGAKGYILKNIDGDKLILSIKKMYLGNSVVSEEMTDKLVSALQQSTKKTNSPDLSSQQNPISPLEILSPREMEILEQLTEGNSNKVIARNLNIAETTVKIHVQHVLRKLDLESRVQAAVFFNTIKTSQDLQNQDPVDGNQ